jgi:hypothetical protein
MKSKSVNKLEIHATDGTSHLRMIAIDQTTKGDVYVCFVNREKQDIHISYHVDVFGPMQNQRAHFQPLNAFKGIHQICSSGFSSDLNKLKSPNYEMKKIRSIVYVDVRRYVAKKLDIGFNIALIEPNITLDTKNIVVPPFTEFHLFPEFIPWILISVYGAKTDRYG